MVGRVCPLCNQQYNSHDRKPMLLGCWHSVCEQCVNGGRCTVCPVCGIMQQSQANIIDRSMLDILDFEEIPCSRDRCFNMSTCLCLKHFHAACDSCSLSICTCRKMVFSEPEVDVGGYLYHKLSKKRTSLPPSLSFKFKGLATIQNTNKLRLLRTLYVVPFCGKCKEPAQTGYYSEKKNDYYCTACSMEEYKSGNVDGQWVPLNSENSTPIEVMQQYIHARLKLVYITDVPENSSLYVYLRDKFSNGTLYELKEIAAEAFSIQIVRAWPPATKCPTCFISYPIDMFQWLPCASAWHGLCRVCITKKIQRNETEVVCPMDGFKFDLNVVMAARS